jgi:hypothetical protein
MEGAASVGDLDGRNVGQPPALVHEPAESATVTPPAAVLGVPAGLLNPAQGRGEEPAHDEDIILDEGLILLDVVPKMTFGVLIGHLAHLAEGLRRNETPWECLHLWWGPWSSKPAWAVDRTFG